MSDEATVMRPEHVFKKVIWRSTVEIGEALERSTTWTIGGVAAIVAVLVSNLDSVAKIASLDGIKTSVVLFTLSLLFGALSKQVGMAVIAGVNTLKQTEALLNSEAGQNLMDKMTIEPRQLVQELAEPFLWPLSTFMRKGGESGLVDYVAGDKRFASCRSAIHFARCPSSAPAVTNRRASRSTALLYVRPGRCHARAIAPSPTQTVFRALAWHPCRHQFR